SRTACCQSAIRRVESPLCRSHARQGLTSRHGFTPKPGRISFRERTCSSTGPLWNRTYTDLNSVCYNSITEQGQMFWIAAAHRRYGSKFDVLSMLSISPGISIDPVETVESGETVDSNNRQQTCGFGANRMKSKWGRSSVG